MGGFPTTARAMASRTCQSVLGAPNLVSSSGGVGHGGAHAIGADGQVSPELQRNPTSLNAHAIATDPTNRFAYVPCIAEEGGVAGNAIHGFSFSSATGALEPTGPPLTPAPTAPGLNRFVWNLRYPDATKPDKELAPDAPPTLGESEPSANGPVAPPGRYQVRLESGELADTQSLEIRRDPRIAASDEDLQRQFEAWRSVCEQLSRISELLDSIRRLRRQLTGWQTTLDDPATPAAEAAKRLAEELDTREQALQAGKAGDLGNRLSEPGSLTEQLNTLLSVIAAADAAPNAAAEEMFELLRARLDEETETWRQLNVGQIAELSAMLVEAGIPPLGG